MNKDTPSTEDEKSPEIFPSQEEITSVFEKALVGKQYKVLRIDTDESGKVTRFDIETEHNGGKAEYNYQTATYDYRNESLPASARYAASIHVVFYDKDGDYDGDDTLANYRDGEWSYTS
ncbi:MAG: hypothetical protein WCO03_02350 [bacterium]